MGIDAQALTGPTWKHGIGRLSSGFIRAVAKHDRDNEYFIVRLAGKELPVSSSFEVIDVPFDGNRSPMDLEANFEYGKSVAKVISRYGIEVYHITTPVTNSAHFPVLTNCAVVTTFYDLIPFKMHYYPRYYPPKAYADYLQKLLLTKRFATRIVAISNSTKHDLIKELGIWPSRIDVVYPALDDSFLSRHGSGASSEKPFVLYVGGGDPRKNLQLLLRAFSLLPKNLLSEYGLFIDVEPEYHADLQETARSVGIREKVKFLEYPDDATLISLYRDCTALILPSLYEGFGLPLLEAMAFSKAILASNSSSIPEVVGDAALLFDPEDLKDATDKMTMLLSDRLLRQSLGRKAFERLSRFSWEKSVSELKKAYVSAVNDKKAFATGRKIAYFSPLYPTQSGISHYSAELLGELTKTVDIDLFVEGAGPVASTGAYSLRPRDASEFESAWRDYGVAVYQVGNSTYHSWMLSALTNHPGVVVLHDFNLHNFLLRHALENDDMFTYLSAMSFQYGEEGLVIAEQQLKAPAGKYVQEYPLNAIVLLFADSLVAVGKKIMRFMIEGRHPEARIIPIGAKVFDETYLQRKRTEARQLLGLSDSAFVFLIAGLIEREAYNQKRLSLCLRVFKRVAERSQNSKLIICGIIDDYVFARLRDEVSSLGLEARVILRRSQAFPADLHVCAYASDVDINLRRDANALASASTVSSLSMGIPVLGSSNELYDEFPNDCVWKVDEDIEEELLFEYMMYLATNPQIMWIMKNRGLRFVKSRTWGRIAQSYVDLIRAHYSSLSNLR